MPANEKLLRQRDSRGGGNLASYCPSRPGELPKLIATEHRTQADGSPCPYLIRIAVLVENVGRVLAVLPDGDEALLHVEGAAGGEDEVQSGVGAGELARLGAHPVADVDGAAAEGEVVLAPVDVGLVPVGVEGHGARLGRQVEEALQGGREGGRSKWCVVVIT